MLHQKFFICKIVHKRSGRLQDPPELDPMMPHATRWIIVLLKDASSMRCQSLKAVSACIIAYKYFAGFTMDMTTLACAKLCLKSRGDRQT